jgi:hypothetical protein
MKENSNQPEKKKPETERFEATTNRKYQRTDRTTNRVSTTNRDGNEQIWKKTATNRKKKNRKRNVSRQQPTEKITERTENGAKNQQPTMYQQFVQIYKGKYKRKKKP